jgi:hypothetical protein
MFNSKLFLRRDVMTKYRIVTKFNNGQLAETTRGTFDGMLKAVEQIRADDQVKGVNVFEEICIMRDYA